MRAIDLPKGFTVDTRLLEILRCPLTQRPLRLLDKDGLRALNQARAASGVPSVAWTAALVADDGRRAYPIEDDIPVLLAGAGIDAGDITGLVAAKPP